MDSINLELVILFSIKREL